MNKDLKNKEDNKDTKEDDQARSKREQEEAIAERVARRLAGLKMDRTRRNIF